MGSTATVLPQEYRRHRIWFDSLPTSLQQQPKVVPPPQGVELKLSASRGSPSDRDMFGGHGLFEDLQPIGVAMAIFGLLPTTFRPIRVSAHPLRSTLMYCVFCSLLVGWSCVRMLRARFALFTDEHGPVSMQTRFTSVLTVAHATGMLLLPLLWVEARHLQRNQAICASLMTSFGHVRRQCRLARWLSWGTVVFGLVLSPTMAVLWLKVVAIEGNHWTHVFVANHVVFLLFVICALFASLFHCIKNFALDMSQSLMQELSLPSPCTRRVAAFRRAWLELRNVTQALVVMPLTALSTLVFILVMFVLAMYLTLVCLLERQLWLGMLIAVMGAHFMLLLLLFCDAVHRAINAIVKSFLQPLETFCGTAGAEAATDEVNIFREVVSTTPVIVTAGGYWNVGRHTMSSILAAAASYLIVLIQFRHIEYSPDDFRNRSAIIETSTAFPQ